MNQRKLPQTPQIYHRSDEVGMISGAAIAKPQADRLETVHDCR